MVIGIKPYRAASIVSNARLSRRNGTVCAALPDEWKATRAGNADRTTADCRQGIAVHTRPTMWLQGERVCTPKNEKIALGALRRASLAPYRTPQIIDHFKRLRVPRRYEK
jgi:hypothetical protein